MYYPHLPWSRTNIDNKRIRPYSSPNHNGLGLVRPQDFSAIFPKQRVKSGRFTGVAAGNPLAFIDLARDQGSAAMR